MRRNNAIFILFLYVYCASYDQLQAQTLQVSLSPAQKVNRTTSGGTATIFFDSNIEDLSIVCTEENPNEQVTKINNHQWFVNIDVNKDIEADGVCYRNYLLKCSASAEYFLTTDEIAPNQVLYYTITLPNDLEPKLLEEKAKYYAKIANQLVDEGDSYLARLILLQVLPQQVAHSLDAEIALRNACLRDDAVLRGHRHTVSSVAFSPDGKYLVSSSDDIRIWDVSTGQQISQPIGKNIGAISSALFSPNGKYIVSASDEIKLWNVLTNKEVRSIEKDLPLFHSVPVAFSPDGNIIASASSDWSMLFWDVKTGKQIGKALKGDNYFINSIVFCPNGKLVASATAGGTIWIWDIKNYQQERQSLEGHTGSINSISFSPNGKHIVSASEDKTLRLWDIKTGMQVGPPMVGHTNGVNSVTFSPDGEYIVSAAKDSTIRIWNVKTMKQVGQTFRNHYGSIESVAISPDGRLIASASADGTVRIWDIMPYKKENHYLYGHTGCIKSAVFSPDGKYILTASMDSTMRIWDSETYEQINQISMGISLNHAEFSPNGKLIAIALNDSTIRIYDAKTSMQTTKPFKHNKEVNYVSFSHDGNRIVSAADNSIFIWNVSTGKAIMNFEGHKHKINCAYFNPTGQYVVSASQDNTARIWDVKTGKQIGLLGLGTGTSKFYYNDNTAKFSPDGKLIVSSFNSIFEETFSIILWDALSYKPYGPKFNGNNNRVYDVAFNPNGKYIASASYDGIVRVWNSESGKQVIQPFVGHTDRVLSVSFSSDGNRIVSASSDNTVHIWDFPLLENLIKKNSERFKDRLLTPEEKAKYNLD